MISKTPVSSSSCPPGVSSRPPTVLNQLEQAIQQMNAMLGHDVTRVAEVEKAWKDLMGTPDTALKLDQAQRVLDRAATVPGCKGTSLLEATIKQDDAALFRLALGHPFVLDSAHLFQGVTATILHGRPAMLAQLLPKMQDIIPSSQSLLAFDNEGRRRQEQQTLENLLSMTVTSAHAMSVLPVLLNDPRLVAAARPGQVLKFAIQNEADDRVVDLLLPLVQDVTPLLASIEKEVQHRMQVAVSERLHPSVRPGLPRSSLSAPLPDMAKHPPTAQEKNDAWAPAWRLIDRLSDRLDPLMMWALGVEHGEEHFPRWRAFRRAQAAVSNTPDHPSRRRRPRA
jgi:hypothetical protein